MQVSDSVVNGGGHGAQDSKSCRVGGKDAKRLGRGGGSNPGRSGNDAARPASAGRIADRNTRTMQADLVAAASQ